MTLLYNSKERKYIKSSLRIFLHHLGRFVVYLILLGLLQSAVTPFHYQPFTINDSQWYNPARIRSLGQLGNNMIHARE